MRLEQWQIFEIVAKGSNVDRLPVALIVPVIAIMSFHQLICQLSFHASVSRYEFCGASAGATTSFRPAVAET